MHNFLRYYEMMPKIGTTKPKTMNLWEVSIRNWTINWFLEAFAISDQYYLEELLQPSHLTHVIHRE
jgi:hypothetical protein